MGAASMENGLFYYETKYGQAFNAQDVVGFLQRLKVNAGNERTFIFMDNAGIHRAKDVRYYLTRSENRFCVIYNAVNRPDCNGIEEIWGHAKRKYKDRIAWLKANP